NVAQQPCPRGVVAPPRPPASPLPLAVSLVVAPDRGARCRDSARTPRPPRPPAPGLPRRLLPVGQLGDHGPAGSPSSPRSSTGGTFPGRPPEVGPGPVRPRRTELDPEPGGKAGPQRRDVSAALARATHFLLRRASHAGRPC